MKSNITTIIPVHDMDDNLKVWFDKAIQSISNSKVKPDEVIIVRCPCKHVIKELESYDFGDIKDIVRVVENKTVAEDGRYIKDFSTQMNKAIDEVKTEFFSILQLDDEYSNIWIKNVVEYVNSYPNVSGFLPIIIETDTKGVVMGTSNEAIWAQDFGEERGFLDMGLLERFPNVAISGGVYKTKSVKELGGFKPSLKTSFAYEFLLRLVYNDKKIMVIPKYGYKHTNMREGSLTQQFQDKESGLSKQELMFWFETAKKEYFFNEDRGITYGETASA